MDDKEIIELYWQRNQDAISETQKKYGKYCFSISYGILKDFYDSEECVNDTYLHVWNSIPPQSPSIFSAFIGQVTRMIALDKWRSKHAKKRGGNEVDLSLDELAESIPSQDDWNSIYEKEELSRIISEFLSELPETERNIFIHRYWHFKSINDICKTYGFGKSKTKMILKRTRDKLHACLKKEGIYQ